VTIGVSEARLTDEITDLRSALAGAPPPLRERGLFASYESRLQSLQEQLLSLRLERMVTKYAQPEMPEEKPAVRRTDPSNTSASFVGVSRAVETVERIRRRRHRSTIGYRYTSFGLYGAMLIGGLVLAGNTPNVWRFADHIGTTVALITIGQILIRHFENVKSEAEYQLELLRNQLEMLGSVYRSKQMPEPKLYERTLALLDEARVE